MKRLKGAITLQSKDRKFDAVHNLLRLCKNMLEKVLNGV
jgi:hypothetical protein